MNKTDKLIVWILTSILLILLVSAASVRTADVGGTGTGNYYGSNIDLLRIGDI